MNELGSQAAFLHLRIRKRKEIVADILASDTKVKEEADAAAKSNLLKRR